MAPGHDCTLDYAAARAHAQDYVGEWSYDQDPNGFCHVRPVWIALLAELDEREKTIRELARQMDTINNALSHAGIDYPQGARGVRDLAGLHLRQSEELDAYRRSGAVRA